MQVSVPDDFRLYRMVFGAESGLFAERIMIPRAAPRRRFSITKIRRISAGL
jgi:hypothetical protein